MLRIVSLFLSLFLALADFYTHNRWTAIRSVSIQFEPSSQRFYYLFHVHSGLRCDAMWCDISIQTHTHNNRLRILRARTDLIFFYIACTGPFMPIKASTSINTFICKTYNLVLIYGRMVEFEIRATNAPSSTGTTAWRENQHPKFNRMNSNWREMLCVYAILCAFHSNCFCFALLPSHISIVWRRIFCCYSCCSCGCGCLFELRLLPFSFHFVYITFSSPSMSLSLSPSFSTCF